LDEGLPTVGLDLGVGRFDDAAGLDLGLLAGLGDDRRALFLGLLELLCVLAVGLLELLAVLLADLLGLGLGLLCALDATLDGVMTLVEDLHDLGHCLADHKQ